MGKKDEKTCPNCGGTGEIDNGDHFEPNPVCEMCGGTGVVPA
jgi:DnaJ-class molecular chaperone